MESYIEVTFFFSFLLIFSSGLAAAYWCQKPCSLKQLAALSALAAGHGCLAWYPGALAAAALIEIVLYLAVFHYSFKTILVSLTFRWLLSFTFVELLDASIARLIVYIPIDGAGWLLVSFFMILADFMLVKNWGYRMGKQDYMYPVKIRLDENCISTRAFLDSGNSLTYQNIPVIFLSAQLEKEGMKKNIVSVPLATVSDSHTVDCVEGQLEICGTSRQKVYVAFSPQLRKDEDTRCLLNIKCFTVKNT